ncbi:MAG: GNAT family N-acetyltransferase [Kineosporiaceae bacterium]
MLSTGTSPRVTVADTVDAVEQLREVWTSLPVPDIDAQIDYFLTVTRSGPKVLTPYVIHARLADGRDLLAVARVELRSVPLSVGYRAVAEPLARHLVLAFGGLLGVTGPEDVRLLVGLLRDALRAGVADVLLLAKVAPDGEAAREVERTVGWLWRSHGQRPTGRWTAELPGSLDGFLAHRSAKTRQKLRTKDRKLEKKYGDRLRLRRLGDPADLDSLARDMAAVGVRTYQHGLGVAFCGEGLDLALMRTAVQHGWFRSWLLYLDDRPVAFWAGTLWNGTFSPVTPGFDPALSQDSIGHYTMFRMVEDLCADPEAVRLDFGHGDARYKTEFARAETHEVDLLIWRRSPRAAALNLALAGQARANAWGRMLASRTSLGHRVKRRWRQHLQRCCQTGEDVGTGCSAPPDTPRAPDAPTAPTVR